MLPYFGVGVLLWYALLQPGVHATLVGVLCAFAIPARPKHDPALFSARIKQQVEHFDRSHQQGNDIMTNEKLWAVVQSLEQGVRRRLCKSWSMIGICRLHFCLVIPIFALFNAGIPLQMGALLETITHPVLLGVSFGLVLGKVHRNFWSVLAASVVAGVLGFVCLWWLGRER